MGPGSSSESNVSAQALLDMMESHFLNQVNEHPTRCGNILDLFITNDSRLVTHVSVEETDLSDHKLVDVMLANNPTLSEERPFNYFDENEFRSLDFNEADNCELDKKLLAIDWEQLRESSSFEEFPEVFTKKTL